MPPRDSLRHTVLVALGVSVVCSVFVSAAATVLKPAQARNKLLDEKRNILAAAGMLEPGATAAQVEAAFAQFDPRIVDLASGEFVEGDALAYDYRAARKDVDQSRALSSDEDLAGIKRLPERMVVYLLPASDGSIGRVVLPVWGYGLWSTMWGFLALESDLNTVVGLGFYEHGETPGLGGEIDNPKWKALWPGKQVYDASGQPAIDVTKNPGEPGSDRAKHTIDALSGATITSNGVENMIRFWLGPNGYGPLLAKLGSRKVAP